MTGIGQNGGPEGVEPVSFGGELNAPSDSLGEVGSGEVGSTVNGVAGGLRLVMTAGGEKTGREEQERRDFALTALMYRLEKNVMTAVGNKVESAFKANPGALSKLTNMERSFHVPNIVEVTDKGFWVGSCGFNTPMNTRNMTRAKAGSAAGAMGIGVMQFVRYKTIQGKGVFDVDGSSTWLADKNGGVNMFGGRDGARVYVEKDLDDSGNPRGSEGYGQPTRGWRGEFFVPWTA